MELANVLYDTAALRAGYSLRDNELIRFADRIDRIVRENLGVDLNAQVNKKKTHSGASRIQDLGRERERRAEERLRNVGRKSGSGT